MTNWRAVWAVYGGGLVTGAYVTKVAPVLPILRDELGVTLLEAGLIATTFNLMGMLIGMLAGVLCDRLGHKQLALAGLLFMGLGGLWGAASGGFASLLATRFLEGLGCILYIVSGPALMSAATATPRDRTKAIGLWTSYMPTGGAIALFAAPWLTGEWGWRGFWIILALAAIAIAVPFARTVPTSTYGNVSSLRLVAESLKQRANLVMALLFAFYVAQWTPIMVWLPTFMVEEQGASLATAALATALMVVVNGPSNIVAGWLIAHGVRRQALVLVGSGIAALCEIGMFTEALPGGLRFALVLLFSFSTGFLPAAVFTGVPLHAKTAQHIGTGNGIVMQASQTGQFLSPLLFAWVASRFGGWSTGLWLLLAFAGCAALCGVALGHFERKLSRL